MPRGIRPCSCSPFDVWGVKVPERITDPPDDVRTSTAVKVPAIYRPYVRSNGQVGQGSLPPRDSSEPGSDQWQCGLGPARYVGNGILDPDGSRVVASRAIYLDGRQKWIVYNTTDSADPQYDLGGHFNFVDIDTQAAEIVSLQADGVSPGTALASLNVSGGGGQPSPGCWSVGREYVVVSFYYENATTWRVYRIQFTMGGQVQFQTEDEVGFVGDRWNILRPTRRAYLRSDTPSDEPWCLARRLSDGGVRLRIATGRWQNTDEVLGDQICALNDSEIEHVLIDSSTLPALECVCYNRVRGRDLAIFMYDAGGTSDAAYWYHDGNSLNEITNGDAPTFITIDHDDAIWWGSKGFIRKVGGFRYDFTTTGATSVVNSKLFEILPNRKWIQLRGVQGTLTDASFLMDIDHPIAGPDGDYHGDPGTGGELSEPFLGWSISYDGEVRLPHCVVIDRPDAPVESHTEGVVTDPPGRKRFVGREYQNHAPQQDHVWVPNPDYPDFDEFEVMWVRPHLDCVAYGEIYFASSASYGVISNQSFDVVDCPNNRCLPAVWDY